MTAATLSSEPLLLELDEKTWKDQIDRVETWLGNLLMTQVMFRKLAEDTVDKIHEPHIKAYLQQMAEKAREHEGKAEEMFALIGRDPSRLRKLGGSALAAGQEVMGAITGLAGGAHGSWKAIRQLLLACVDSQGAFAMAEQLGYAMAMPALSDLAFGVVLEKSADELLLKEYMLEMGPVAILYHMNA